MKLYRVIKKPEGAHYYIVDTKFVLDSLHRLRKVYGNPTELNRITSFAPLVTKPHS